MMSLEDNTCLEFCWRKSGFCSLYHRQQLWMSKDSISEGQGPREKPEADLMVKVLRPEMEKWGNQSFNVLTGISK